MRRDAAWRAHRPDRIRSYLHRTRLTGGLPLTRMLLDDPLDPRVREYAHLRAATLRLRAEGPDGARDGIFIAEGELVIERALALGYRMRSLLLLEQRIERFGRLAPADVPVYAATNE